MNRRFSAAILLLVTCGLGFSPLTTLARSDEEEEQNEEEISNAKPDAGGVTIEPSHGKIAEGDTITITFPVAMVAPDLIDLGDQPCPFISQPKLEGTFLWKSQTEGVFTVSGVVAGARHRLTLDPTLKDASGKPFVLKDWSAEFGTPKFAITTEFTERKQLPARPQVYLDSTYAVRLDEAAEHIYFQDRESRQRFPVEVIQTAEEKTASPLEGTGFRVTPRVPLPVERTFDLIVNGLLEAKSHRPLPYLQVMPMGKTAPLTIEWLGAFNHALEDPAIRIKFNDYIDPVDATPDRIRVEPAVEKMKLLASNDEIEITGSFDLKQHYRVAISPELKGDRGYGLAAESHWGATFRPKESCLIFPSTQVFARARQELRFAFFQVNTPEVTWKLARIPTEKLSAVSARVKEFERDATNPITGKTIIDPRTGFTKQFQTELLVDAFHLPVSASGTCDAASGDTEMRREVRCTSRTSEEFAGPYLLEASAILPDGRIVGNRSMICVNDYLLTQKRTPNKVIMRLGKMSDGSSVTGVTVHAVTEENIELARAITDNNGMAEFSRDTIFPQARNSKGTHLFIAETSTGLALQFAEGTAFPSGNDYARAARTSHAEIITDRNLYRAGQMVKMKGIVRDATQFSGLTIPFAAGVHWSITEADGSRVVGEGDTVLSSYGGWEGEWRVPEKAKLGSYEIRCRGPSGDYQGVTLVSVQEYRVPLFSVLVEATTPEVGSTAHARISSAYFHGAPNAGARVHWKATWATSPEYGNEVEGAYRKRFNTYAEIGPSMDPNSEDMKTIEGDTQLDAHGFATLVCESPFKDNAAVGRTSVVWRADVTSIDGQTLSGGDTATLFSTEIRLGVRTEEQINGPAGVKVEIDALDPDDKKIDGVLVRADLFHVATKTVKEQLAPFVYRYRNTDQFAKVASQEAKTPADLIFSTTNTGRYVVAVNATKIKTPVVSDETTITGEKPAELPVINETTFKIEHRAEPFVPGDNAALTIQAPFGGVAWVSVETDDVLDTLLIPVKGNAGRIELPIKENYAPNATISIYLVKPGGDKELPLERFAYTDIEVRRPDRELKIAPHLITATAKPGDVVRGDVLVTSSDKPVPDVDLLVFAVDDAVLTLGDWKLPNIGERFYPKNPFSVRTYEALHGYIENVAKLSLTQKGFTIGDGGEEAVSNVKNVRKEFRTLAYWQGNLKTGADGKVKFEFIAPDNLTTYRVVALGQTKANQFGGDANETVKISKPLLIDLALPRFLRDGDEVELRAVVRQNFADSDSITARCLVDGRIKLFGEAVATQSTQRDAPIVFRFKAKVADPDCAPTKVRFEAVSNANKQMSDAVEITLPVQPPTIVRKESVAGSFKGPHFDARRAMPEEWKGGHGQFNTTISTSPWLPEIAGLPAILEYPHGCFEQISTKLLGYSLLANLLAYLPDFQQRDAEYRATLERGMKQFADSLLSDGMLPYWPGGDTGNGFVTCQALWSVNESINAGLEPPPELQEKLSSAVSKVVQGQLPASRFEKCFALFVLTQTGKSEDFRNESQELYLHRNEGTDEDRALLAIALHQQNIMAGEQQQLLREIDKPIKERAFNPATFTSMTRAEAMRAFAFNLISPATWTKQRKQQARDRMSKLMDGAGSLSTQENLWLLLAFKSMLGAETTSELHAPQPPADVLSKNGRSAAWFDRKIENELAVKDLNQSALTFLMQAEYSTNEVDTDRVDRGFRVERVVKNLTDATRVGTPDAPLKLGDQLLIAYRLNTRKVQNFVALEDSLPAGIEVVNPNLALVGKFYQLPPLDPQDRLLGLSYSEMRDRSALLYFDAVDPGSGTYSILARATAAGTFRWPATQVAPMYDSRFSGLCPSSVCVISAD
ncbi:MAG TPA: alpha-2-macroglobulin family protein [Candidatus Udaeobacter sp.]|nr:alpha-2-macroglobulin family protein [Candidatus Udaeobacter sp.]